MVLSDIRLKLEKMKFKTTYIAILSILFMACGEGYEQTGANKWSWVSRNEAGKQMRAMDVDHATFEILDNSTYAKDKNSVYWRGLEIPNADPETFMVVTENGYAKDQHKVYLDNEVVIFADPNTFEVIAWPYSKDDQRIYNGNLPMEVAKIKDFEITKNGSGKTSSTKAFFIEWNEEYKWMDTLNVTGIIVGEDAEAKTGNKRYRGFKLIR